MPSINATPLYPRPEATNMIDLFTYIANNGIGHDGAFGYIVLVMVFGILFISMKAFRSEQALTGALFITGIVAMALGLLGMVELWIAYILLIVAAAMVFLYRN